MATNNAINVQGPTAFMSSRRTSNANNVTGDGTIYTVTYNSEEFDTFGSFDPATGVFVAPYTGKYIVTFYAGQMVNLHAYSNPTCKMTISTTARDYTYTTNPFVESGGLTGYTPGFTTVCDMTAGDTLVTRVQISGGTKNIILFNTAGTYRSTFLSTAFLTV